MEVSSVCTQVSAHSEPFFIRCQQRMFLLSHCSSIIPLSYLFFFPVSVDPCHSFSPNDEHFLFRKLSSVSRESVSKSRFKTNTRRLEFVSSWRLKWGRWQILYPLLLYLVPAQIFQLFFWDLWSCHFLCNNYTLKLYCVFIQSLAK